MKIIGITGGTGAGKTTALGILKQMGCETIDCDAVYHELLQSDPELKAELVSRFGDVVTDGAAGERGLTCAAIDAIALIESALSDRCDAVVGILAPAERRIRRIMEREGIDESYARMRIEAQKPDSFFREHCDYILENNGDEASFREAAAALFRNLLG